MVFLRKGVLKICSTFTVKHPFRGVIPIKLLCNYIEIPLWHGFYCVNLLHVFRTPFSTFGRLLVFIGEADRHVSDIMEICLRQKKSSVSNCGALRDLVLFVQFKTFATLLKVALLHGCFSRFLNCAYGTKSRNAPQLWILKIKNLFRSL